MIDWYSTLTVLEQVYLWLGIVATVFLIIQIVMLCFTSYGGDVDLDGDGDIDVDMDSGVSIFTVKSLTAFFAVGSWAGLLTCALIADNLQWVSAIVALVSGAVRSRGAVNAFYLQNAVERNFSTRKACRKARNRLRFGTRKAFGQR